MNPVYRAVESKAHGLLPLVFHDFCIVVPIAVGAGVFHPLAGVAAVVAATAVVFEMRRRFDGRRDWLATWLRMREPPQYSVLEPDRAYRHYPPPRRAEQ